MSKRPSDNQEAVATFWRNNAGHCVSGLIGTLAMGFGDSGGNTCLTKLCDKADALTEPLEDYEEAARQEGWQWDEGGPHFFRNVPGASPLVPYDYQHIKDGNWETLCEAEGLEPYQWEVYEHWIVDQWLAEKLSEKGERVDMDFEGLCIWGRTCTGQAVSMDSVICEIYDDLHADDHA